MAEKINISDSESIGLTSEQLIEKLKSALRKDGDFPATAKLVTELRRLTSDPKTTANQVTEVILKEPSLATRVLHLVNSSFYRRVKPIMTVSQAVVQIGMKPLADMCAGLVLLQRFVPAARRDGAFAGCLQKTIITSLLSSSLGKSQGGGSRESKGEKGYLAGSFAELGTLLLAFYFPQVYESAIKRAAARHQEVGQSIKDITGISPLELSIEVLEALELPTFYRDILKGSHGLGFPVAGPAVLPSELNDMKDVSKCLTAAESISEAVVFTKSKKKLDAILQTINKDLKIEDNKLNEIIGELPQMFKDHCSMIELTLAPLPDFVQSYATDSNNSGDNTSKDQFSHFITEIKDAIEHREPTSSVITTVMETLAWGLKFDRVLLLLVNQNRKQLTGRMLLGTPDGTDPKGIRRPLGLDAAKNAPDNKAFNESRPVFIGDPIFPNGWPLVAFPVGFGSRTIGVIYADKKSQKGDDTDLDEKIKAAIGLLSELLDRSISMTS